MAREWSGVGTQLGPWSLGLLVFVSLLSHRITHQCDAAKELGLGQEM